MAAPFIHRFEPGTAEARPLRMAGPLKGSVTGASRRASRFFAMAMTLRWVGADELDRIADTRFLCYGSAEKDRERFRERLRNDPRSKPGDYVLAEIDGQAVGTATRLSLEFSRNIQEGAKTVLVENAAELEGLPADYLARHTPNCDGHYALTTDQPDMQPVMTFASFSMPDCSSA